MRKRVKKMRYEEKQNASPSANTFVFCHYDEKPTKTLRKSFDSIPDDLNFKTGFVGKSRIHYSLSHMCATIRLNEKEVHYY